MNDLMRIQRELKAPKDKVNAFGKYKYRSCEGILEAVKPLLNGCALILTDDVRHIGGFNYLVATATLIEVDGKEYAVTAFAREPVEKKGMDDSQITGAASSYARKYALNGLFAIDDNQDADATNTHGVEKNTLPVFDQTNPNWERARIALKEGKTSIEKISERWQLDPETIKKLTA